MTDSTADLITCSSPSPPHSTSQPLQFPSPSAPSSSGLNSRSQVLVKAPRNQHQHVDNEINEEDDEAEQQQLNPSSTLAKSSDSDSDGHRSKVKLSALFKLWTKVSSKKDAPKKTKDFESYPQLRCHTGSNYDRAKKGSSSKRAQTAEVQPPEVNRSDSRPQWELVDEETTTDDGDGRGFRGMFSKDGKTVAQMILAKNRGTYESYDKRKKKKTCHKCGRIEKMESSYISSSSQGLSRASSTLSGFSSGYTTRTTISSSVQKGKY